MNVNDTSGVINCALANEAFCMDLFKNPYKGYGIPFLKNNTELIKISFHFKRNGISSILYFEMPDMAYVFSSDCQYKRNILSKAESKILIHNVFQYAVLFLNKHSIHQNEDYLGVSADEVTIKFKLTDNMVYSFKQKRQMIENRNSLFGILWLQALRCIEGLDSIRLFEEVEDVNNFMINGSGTRSALKNYTAKMVKYLLEFSISK
mgnify:CR=1 FL=1